MIWFDESTTSPVVLLCIVTALGMVCNCLGAVFCWLVCAKGKKIQTSSRSESVFVLGRVWPVGSRHLIHIIISHWLFWCWRVSDQVFQCFWEWMLFAFHGLAGRRNLKEGQERSLQQPDRRCKAEGTIHKNFWLDREVWRAAFGLQSLSWPKIWSVDVWRWIRTRDSHPCWHWATDGFRCLGMIDVSFLFYQTRGFSRRFTQNIEYIYIYMNILELYIPDITR